jgi:hypothetical protein
VNPNRNVTVTDHACPQHFCAPQGACGEPESPYAVSQLVQTEAGFPADVVGTTELHATFREESRTSLFSASAAPQEIRRSDRHFRGFLPRKTTPRERYRATVIAKVL